MNSLQNKPVPTALLIHPDELSSKWIERAKRTGLTTLSIHPVGGGHAVESLENLIECCKSDNFTKLVDEAIDHGLKFEYECHAGSWLLPRSLFSRHPEYFRIGNEGERTDSLNFCVSNEEALKIVCDRARLLARSLYRSTNRYYFWLDDAGNSECKCPICAQLSPSDQQMLVLNRIIEALRKDNPDAELAYLAYAGTIRPPEKIKPAPGIFLEYAPISRKWDKPLTSQDVVKTEDIAKLMEFFGKRNSRVLEYWYDNSLFSGWKKPPKQLNPNFEVMHADIKWYFDHGFEEIASFACYLGPDYEALWGEPPLECVQAVVS